MAELIAATKAELALVLPSLLVVSHLERNGTLPSSWLPLSKTYRRTAHLGNRASIQLTFPDGEGRKVWSDRDIIEHLVVSKPKVPSLRSALVEEWVQRSNDFALRNALRLNHHKMSVADVAVWATIRGNPIALSLVKTVYCNVFRWYSFIEASNPWIVEAIKALTSAEMMERAREKAARSAAGSNLDVIALLQVDGPMVTRFPPEPSGYLHIGHAKAALLNDYFAHQKPGGVLICRFDDTNPSRESMDFQNSITESLALISIVPDKTSYSSDYFQQMYALAVQLIKDGKAFADDSELGKGDDSRKNRLPSKHRDMGIEETLARFEEMKTGSIEGQRWCLRARIAYDSPNGTLRDPVIYRCNLTKHHRTGTSWKIYPTYDFCAPVLDSIEGITLALRTNEYRDRNAQYEWIQNALGLRPVPIWDFSRLNFVRNVLSKRKLTRIVNEGKVWDWGDPWMPTINGIIRRGVAVPVLRDFILKQGPSRNILNLEWGTFWAANRKYIDPLSPRHVAIAAGDVVYCDVVIDKTNNGLPPEHVGVLEVPKYVKNPSLGTRKIQTGKTIIIEQADAQSFEIGEMITLMNWGNAIVRDISTTTGNNDDKSTTLVKHLVLDLDLTSRDFKKTKKVTWLAASQDNMVPVELMAFDHLINKDKLEPTDVLEECLTPVTQFTTVAFADCNVVDLEKGAVIQFERKAYYRLDRGRDGSSPMVFFEIPSGGK
ncbi:glutamyl-tRNA synthetase [Talaromyces islandicus]|uniref:glutamate--tRNA ligase n=1 Tax=Talaromyces islandicus TaxID=28573 RepID=A0A0U1LYP8_TALIS|nr:glutamyl-tRNA synthetase [Talaromyces islandicus]